MALSPQLAPYGSVALATLAYIMLYYVFIGYQGRVKAKVINRINKELKDGKQTNETRYNCQDPDLLVADRTMLNMLEQMPPFLVTLWLHAIFVSPVSATIGAWIYIATRAIYPFVFVPYKAAFKISIGFSTAPNCT